MAGTRGAQIGEWLRNNDHGQAWSRYDKDDWPTCSFRRFTSGRNPAGSIPGHPLRCDLPIATDPEGLDDPHYLLIPRTGEMRCFCKRHRTQVEKAGGIARYGLIDDDFLPERYMDVPDDKGYRCHWTKNLDGVEIIEQQEYGAVKGSTAPKVKKPKKKMVPLDDKDRRIADLEGQLAEAQAKIAQLLQGTEPEDEPEDEPQTIVEVALASYGIINDPEDEPDLTPPPRQAVSVSERVAAIEPYIADDDEEWIECDDGAPYIEGIYYENADTGEIRGSHPDGLPKLGKSRGKWADNCDGFIPL